jgi:hypothetical protein
MNRHLPLALGAMALGCLLLLPHPVMADPPAHARNDHHHRHHDRHWDAPRDDYPWHGYVVERLPPRPRVAHYHGDRYYYSRGHWYRPFGPGFVVVRPPAGLVVSFLPDFHTTLYFGGVPYYQAGPVFYVWSPRARAYVVTDWPYHHW